MPLTKCKECKEDVSTRAKNCPVCGAPVRRTRLGVVLLGVILFFALLGLLVPDSEKLAPSPNSFSPGDRGYATGTDFTTSREVAVAIDDSALHVFNELRAANDNLGLTKLLKSGRIFTVEEGTAFKVLDSSWNHYKVRVLGGPQRANAGWIRKDRVSKRAPRERDAQTHPDPYEEFQRLTEALQHRSPRFFRAIQKTKVAQASEQLRQVDTFLDSAVKSLPEVLSKNSLNEPLRFTTKAHELLNVVEEAHGDDVAMIHRARWLSIETACYSWEGGTTPAKRYAAGGLSTVDALLLGAGSLPGQPDTGYLKVSKRLLAASMLLDELEDQPGWTERIARWNELGEALIQNWQE